MSQILHIFKKDARHLWPEIVVSLAVTAIFVRTSLMSLSGSSPSEQILTSLFIVFLPIGWWAMIFRLIHDESLVGNSQFWITRPYEWKNLIAAKALFLLIFLYLPFSLAQMAILSGTGFHPFAHLTGFLYNLLLITTILVLPGIAIATVTATFARAVLVLLASIAYLALIFWALSSIPGFGHSFPEPYTGKLALFLPLIVFLLAIALQYATRRIWRSRWMLLSLPFLVIACDLALPLRLVANHRYPPVSTTETSMHLAFDPSPDSIPNKPAVATASPAERVDLRLPFTVSDIPTDTLLNAQAIRVSIDTPTGGHWTSRWTDPSAYYLSGTTRSTLDVMLDRKAFERLRATSARVTLTYAFTQLRSDAPVTIPAGAKDFTLPNGGICSNGWVAGFSTVCRFAFSEPRLFSSTAQWSAVWSYRGPCPPSGSSSFGNNRWIGVAEPAPAEFSLNPVQNRPLIFLNSANGMSGPCVLTQITTTSYAVVRRLQATFTTPEIDLTKYALDDHQKFPSSTRTSVLISTH